MVCLWVRPPKFHLPLPRSPYPSSFLLSYMHGASSPEDSRKAGQRPHKMAAGIIPFFYSPGTPDEATLGIPPSHPCTEQLTLQEAWAEGGAREHRAAGQGLVQAAAPPSCPSGAWASPGRLGECAFPGPAATPGTLAGLGGGLGICILTSSPHPQVNLPQLVPDPQNLNK